MKIVIAIITITLLPAVAFITNTITVEGIILETFLLLLSIITTWKLTRPIDISSLEKNHVLIVSRFGKYKRHYIKTPGKTIRIIPFVEDYMVAKIGPFKTDNYLVPIKTKEGIIQFSIKIYCFWKYMDIYCNNRKGVDKTVTEILNDLLANGSKRFVKSMTNISSLSNTTQKGLRIERIEVISVQVDNTTKAKLRNLFKKGEKIPNFLK